MREEHVAAHLTGQLGTCFLHFGLNQAVPGLPHQRLAAQFGDPFEQRAAGLNIRDNRGPGDHPQQILGIDHQQLVAPHDPPGAVDRADPVAVAIESHSEIEVLGRDQRPKIGEVLLLGRIRMMVGKIPVDFGEQQEVLPWEPGGERFERGTRRAVARVPTDAKSGQAIVADPAQAFNQPFNQPVDVSGHDIAGLAGTVARGPGAGLSHAAEFEDILAEERSALKYHLEAIIIGGIVAAGYLNAALHILG